MHQTMYNYSMLPFVGPDIEQAIRHTFKLTLLHNAYPVVLFFGILISVGFALHKPSRARILFAVGLSLLLMHFEYGKHIADPLLQQTQVTLTTDTVNHRFVWLVNKLITRIIPFFLLVGGVIATITSLLLSRLIRKK